MTVSCGERFWAKVDLKDFDGCWLWTSCITIHGYGHFYMDGGNKSAHRLAYEWLVGPIPEGLQLDHLCRVRHCVNPLHLEPVTGKENINRGLRSMSLRTHCPQGHPYDEENTYVSPKGDRRCRECHRIRSRKRHEVRS